jgi:hypothetical protein
MGVFLSCDHPLSIKFQNSWFKIEERFSWQSPDGAVACLSITSGIASARASEKLGWDTQANFIVKAVDLSLILDPMNPVVL